MQVGDFVHGGYYAGDHDGHHIICSPIEYELPLKVNWNKANEYCKKLGMEIPTREELDLIYNLYKANRKIIPRRFYPWYWASSLQGTELAHYQSFSFGSQGIAKNTDTLFTRPIIRIKIES